MLSLSKHTVLRQAQDDLEYTFFTSYWYYLKSKFPEIGVGNVGFSVAKIYIINYKITLPNNGEELPLNKERDKRYQKDN